MEAREGPLTGTQDMLSVRHNRLREQLPRDDAACKDLMAYCAACLVVLLVGVVAFDPDVQRVDGERGANRSRSAEATRALSRFEPQRHRLAVAPWRIGTGSTATREAPSTGARPSQAH
ncbi:MAG TPA: hypothetical protein VLR71_10990 [Casimicrobiaceae bacterium]|nr:hypothetical protein [Casimicrobiaceae bacterium]